MAGLRSLGLLSLLAFLSTPCASAPPQIPSETLVQGILGSGGPTRYKRSNSEGWALSVVGSDVLLEIDGAEVRFLDGAPHGRLAYRHFEAAATWRLQLAGGIAHCEGHDLEFGGHHYQLRDGLTYHFDGTGSLESVR